GRCLMADDTFPPAAIRLWPKRGDHDCTIAALASYLRRHYEEVLIAAAKVAPKCWATGLSGPEVTRVARRLGFRVRWRQVDQNDLAELDDLTGILDLRFWNKPQQQHVVLIIEGVIYEADDDPITRWDPLTYC